MNIARPMKLMGNHASRLLLVALIFLALLFSGMMNAGFAQSPPAAPQPDQAAGGPSKVAPSAPKIQGKQTLLPADIIQGVQRAGVNVARLEKSVERVRQHDDQLEALRPEIKNVANDAAQTERALQPHIANVDRLLTGLGDEPKDTEPPETPAIAAERARLNAARGQLQGALQRARLTQVRAKQLIARIQSLRLENLGRNLRKQHPSPFSVAHWRRFADDVPRFGGQVSTVGANWWTVARGGIHWLFLITVGAGCLWWGIWSTGKTKVRHWMREPLETVPPAYLARVGMAVRTFPFLLAPGLITAGFVYMALWACGLFNEQIDGLAFSALKAVALFLVTNALAKTILLPWESSWRLIGLATPVARRYLWLTRLLAGVYCLDLWLNEVFSALQVPISIGITTGLLTNLAFAALLFLFAWSPTHDEPETDEQPAEASVEPALSDETVAEETTEAAVSVRQERASARLMRNAIYLLRVPATVAVVVIIGATLLGYLALGRFVAGQVMLVGISASVVLFGHLAARALATEPDIVSPALDNVLENQLALSARRRQQAFSALSVLLNLGLGVGAVALLLLSWGYSQAELASWAGSLVFGFEIGKFKFSLLQILIAITLFAAVIALTRIVQSWLSRRLLAGERVDRGIANSINSGIGYAGVALAALIGVSYAGLDLSNVALIASALSIGIGFGLNAIASNFVSGLIMLIERPIKVGDWVVVGAYQGYVRHISVRATEIETFDRASVIIPNSDFMTSPVQNWTHRNAMARVIVNIGVSYDSDPNEVLAVLRQVADDCELLLSYPAPSVHFEEFGASSLDFSVRGYIADVKTMLGAKTALRLAITDTFKAANIEIPFPQQDVHLRDLDGVREMVTLAMAKRASEAQAKSAMPHGNDNSGGESGDK